MNEAIISEAQDYLTVEKDEGYKRIVDIQNLLQSHSTKEVILIFKRLSEGKGASFKKPDSDRQDPPENRPIRRRYVPHNHGDKNIGGRRGGENN